MSEKWNVILPSLIARRWVEASDSVMAPTKSYSFYWLGLELLKSVAWTTGVQLVFSFAPGYSMLFGAQGSLSSDSLLNLLSPRFLFIGVVIMIYSFDDSLTS